tara:strand:- start:1602 stop:1946 length:345 start_codon:yes stop_codon:yes gene_type:complete
MQIKSETKLPDTVITVRLTTAKEMYNFSEVTHSHTEYDTDWDELLYSLSEYQGIDSHIYLQYPSEKQPKDGDVVCTITLYCQDTEKLSYLEAEVTKRILTALTITYPWERDGLD